MLSYHASYCSSPLFPLQVFNTKGVRATGSNDANIRGMFLIHFLKPSCSLDI